MKTFFVIVVLAICAALANAKQDNLIEMGDDEYCLALNIYHEARSENLAGKFAVSDVVLNRVRDARWPDTICEVVYQGPTKPSWKDPTKQIPVRNQCQFSWYCDGLGDAPNDLDAWFEARLIAFQILEKNVFRGITEGATHYHATYVKPNWRLRFYQVGRIGSHIFYRAE